MNVVDTNIVLSLIMEDNVINDKLFENHTILAPSYFKMEVWNVLRKYHFLYFILINLTEMANYISSLPDSVLSKLNEVAQTLRVPKNKIIERALIKYLTEVERQLYIRSFRQLAGDEDMLKLVEEGMDEYWRVLEDWDAKG